MFLEWIIQNYFKDKKISCFFFNIKFGQIINIKSNSRDFKVKKRRGLAGINKTRLIIWQKNCQKKQFLKE